MLDSKARKYVQPIIEKTANMFIKLNISAIQVTLIALFIGIISSIILMLGYEILAIIFLWLSGYLDAIDGTVARKTNTQSELGGFLDIVSDRVVEVCMLMALVYITPSIAIEVIFVLGGIIISMTIFLLSSSIIDKRSDKMFYYQTGLAERTEGFLMITLGIIFKGYCSMIMIIFAMIILFTAVQRFREVVKYLNLEER